MSIQTRTAQNVITKENVDDRIVGSTLPYACSGEVDHFQHCVLCCCSGLLWIPCWIVACIVPGFCPTPCGDNCSCEAKRFIDPFKRLMWRLGKVNQVFTVEISPRPQLVAGLVDPSPEILRAPVSGVPCVMYVFSSTIRFHILLLSNSITLSGVPCVMYGPRVHSSIIRPVSISSSSPIFDYSSLLSHHVFRNLPGSM